MCNCYLCEKPLRKFTVSFDWNKRACHKRCIKLLMEYGQILKYIDDEDEKEKCEMKIIDFCKRKLQKK